MCILLLFSIYMHFLCYLCRYLLAVIIFYGIPAYQLVITAQQVQYVHNVYLMIMFDHVTSLLWSCDPSFCDHVTPLLCSCDPHLYSCDSPLVVMWRKLRPLLMPTASYKCLSLLMGSLNWSHAANQLSITCSTKYEHDAWEIQWVCSYNHKLYT